MKLRNKKTGKTIEGLISAYGIRDDVAVSMMGSNAESGYTDLGRYKTLAELNEEWEDYTPADPLIEDEKARKVFQEWVKLYDAERFRVTHFFNSKGHMTLLMSTDLTTEPSIEIPDHIGKDSEIYTIAELCGEEEGLGKCES